jgi:hypothetical protein
LRKHENHIENCKNTVEGSVRTLVSESKAVENNKPIFLETSNQKLIFRMNFLEAAQGILTDLSNFGLWTILDLSHLKFTHPPIASE